MVEDATCPVFAGPESSRHLGSRILFGTYSHGFFILNSRPLDSWRWVSSLHPTETGDGDHDNRDYYEHCRRGQGKRKYYYASPLKGDGRSVGEFASDSVCVRVEEVAIEVFNPEETSQEKCVLGLALLAAGADTVILYGERISRDR